MRKLVRERTTTAVHQNFRGQLREDLSLQLLENQRALLNGTIESHDFKSSRWKHAKKQLLIETNQKCAYCDSPTSVVAYGDVEHYRPKSKYYWLAYDYENYLASCTLCNQRYKKAKFKSLGPKLKSPTVKGNSTDAHLNTLKALITTDPVDENKGMPWSDFINLHLQERPLLLNPYIDDPKDFYAYEVDSFLQEIRVTHTPGLNQGDKYIKAAESDFGINRNELLRLRFDVYLKYYTTRLNLFLGNLTDEQTQLEELSMRKMLSAAGPYSGMLEYFEKTSMMNLTSPLPPEF